MPSYLFIYLSNCPVAIPVIEDLLSKPIFFPHASQTKRPFDIAIQEGGGKDNDPHLKGINP